MGLLRVSARFLGGKRFWAILAICAFHVFNVYSWVRPGGLTKAPVALMAALPTSQNLTCEQTVRLMQWGKGRSRHALKLDLESREFSGKALDAFLEKLDPQRILFTADQVKEFTGEGKKAWKHWAQKKNCDYFDSWVQSHYGKARARLKSNLAAMPMPTQVLKTPVTDVDSYRHLKFSSFAENEKELKARLAGWVERIHQTASQMVFDAYRGDMRRLISESLDQMFFDAEPDARGMLAKAVLSSIDPYSTYFSPVEFEDFYYDLSGGTSGIGIKVRKVPQGLLIEKIVSDSPAGKSKKIREGNIITAVDGVKVVAMGNTAAKALLKGDENSKVKLDLLKGHKGGAFSVTLTRKHFDFEDAKITHRLIGQVSVISIPSFYGRAGMSSFDDERSSSEDLKHLMTQLLAAKKKPSAVVIDLRGNPGGFLEEAVAMAGLFIGSEPVVEVVESDSKRILRHEDSAILYSGPLVLLLDEETASASEVLAGALKDHQRAVLVGSERTYGKGSVQKLFHLDDEMMMTGLAPLLGRGVVKLTTSVFYAPLGHTPANGGIRTHITLPMAAPEDQEPHPSIGFVPEERPFLDENSMAEIKRQEPKFLSRIAQLETSSHERTATAKKIAPALDARKELKRLADEEADSGENQAELDEAVSIASDFVVLDQKARAEEVSLRVEKNDPSKATNATP